MVWSAKVARLNRRVFSKVGDAVTHAGAEHQWLIEQEELDTGDHLVPTLVLKMPSAEAVGVSEDDSITFEGASYRVGLKHPPIDGLTWFELKEA